MRDVKCKNGFFIQRYGAGCRIVNPFKIFLYIIVKVGVVITHAGKGIAFYGKLQLYMILGKTTTGRLRKRSFPDAVQILCEGATRQQQQKNNGGDP